MGDHQFRTRFERDRLRRHPAGPEDWHLAGMNGDGVAIVGAAQIGDPDGLWITGVEGGAMGVRVMCAHLADQLDLRLRNRAHGYHDRSVEAARGTAEKIGDEHRNQGAEFDVAHPDPRLDQGMLEGQAAAEQKADQIVAPEVRISARLDFQTAERRFQLLAVA